MNTVNQVGIYNMALGAVGVSRFIQSLQDTSVQAQTCNVFWESVRDQCLSDYPWNFATRFTALQKVDKHTPGWSRTYALPSDCLAARRIVHNHPLEPKIPFQVVEDEDNGRLCLATNGCSPVLEYTARVVKYTIWSPSFVNAVHLLLATKIVSPLSSAPDKYGPLVGKAYEMAISKAGANSMNEGQERPEPESELITIRG